MPKKISNEEYQLYFNEHYPDYELLSEYLGDKKPVTVKCKLDGHIWNIKPNHLKQGVRCQQCYYRTCGEKKRKTRDMFISEARKVHGEKYDYSKVEYINNKTHVKVVCPIHGEFSITPNKHVTMKHGCSKCASEKNGLSKRLTNEEFIKRSTEIHNNKYDYSKVNYCGGRKKVEIICPIHGSFKQYAEIHLNGCGCPKCQQSHLENKIMRYLEKNNIIYETQKRFNWLGKLSLDFYLPEYNIAIECQGIQHFKNNFYNSFQYDLNTIIERDKRKKELCESNNIKLLYYANDKTIFNLDIYNEENTFISINDLFKKI